MTNTEDRECMECSQKTGDVETVKIAGEEIDLCIDCLPKFKAMDYFGKP